ncbi:pathogenicity island protein [Devosia sp. ZB163]|uniref:pathogenicity island protein n=1 Tax=Devosia sp. ZB163 TaxID=3025938 RepID=UPI0023606BFC|nr:pathogenicity island protein [Devosia sp. ZB163]MDC9823024.1 pathogenicity island protein [Devosia sp. ZB163]
MSVASATQPTGDDETLAALLRGELRNRLGLSSEQLRIGLSVARNHMTRGAPLEALRVYVTLVLCEPANVDFQIGLANCAGVLGEHHLALQAASAVIALAPKDARGYLLSGRSCMMISAFAEAKEDLEDALALAGSDEAVAGEAKLLLGRIAAASTAP